MLVTCITAVRMLSRWHSPFRYLRIEVDDALWWQFQVHVMFGKVFAGFGALNRSRSLVPNQTLLQKEALVLLYLYYCSGVWGCMGKTSVTDFTDGKTRTGRIIAWSDYNKGFVKNGVWVMKREHPRNVCIFFPFNVHWINVVKINLPLRKDALRNLHKCI